MENYLSICEQYADWLREKPRQRCVVVKTNEGAYAIVYYGITEEGTAEGVTLSMEDKDVAPILYPLTNRWEVIEKHESSKDYFASKALRKLSTF